MIQNEIERLAAAAHCLRPDWPIASVRTLLASHANRAYRDCAIALAWIACDPATRTPARLAENGPWWRLALVDQPEPTPTPPRHARDPVVPADPLHAAEAAKRAREAMRAARAATKHPTTGSPDDAACNSPEEP